MKRKSLFLLILAASLLVGGCALQPAESIQPKSMLAEVATSTPAKQVDLNIFAAASLADAFSEIGELFEADHPEVTVVFNFAGSQQLANQINEGAPADVFASANRKLMDAVIQNEGIINGTEQIFAMNRLVAIYPKDNPGGLMELKDLTKPGLKLILASREVPVGQYSLDFLDKTSVDPSFSAAFKDDVLKNVVSYEDNVKAVLTKVALGEADAGIVYISDISGQDTTKVSWIDIPDALNVIVSYPIAPVKDSKNPELAQAFIELVGSQEGQAILAKYNFVPVK